MPGFPVSLPVLLLTLLFAAPVLAESPPPSDPAAAPPAAPDLTQPALPARPVVLPPLALPEGITVLPGQGWRLSQKAALGEPDAAVRAALVEMAHWLSGTSGRVTLVAQVSGPAEDVSAARRATLAHAQAIAALLREAGLEPTRIDLRPMGRTAEGQDAIDLLPPPPPRRAAETPSAAPNQGSPRP